MPNNNPLDPLDQMLQGVLDQLPAGLKHLQHDLEKHLQLALRQGLRKLDLVSRDEFEVQQAVLLRTREKLEALEKIVAGLEQQRRG
ncbi:MAG: accessory factor UbiK family protein [Gammaproteobacteria bacterium]